MTCNLPLVSLRPGIVQCSRGSILPSHPTTSAVRRTGYSIRLAKRFQATSSSTSTNPKPTPPKPIPTSSSASSSSSSPFSSLSRRRTVDIALIGAGALGISALLIWSSGSKRAASTITGTKEGQEGVKGVEELPKDFTISVPTQKGKRVDATVKMLTSEEVERMLRENESTHAVSRPGNPVYRFDTNALASNSPIEDNEVVALVGGWLDGVRGSLTRREALARVEPPVRTLESPHAPRPEKSGEGPDFVFEDQNISTHLIRNALGGKAKERVSTLLSIPAPFSRRYRDDITVTVILIDENQGGKSGDKVEGVSRVGLDPFGRGRAKL